MIAQTFVDTKRFHRCSQVISTDALTAWQWGWLGTWQLQVHLGQMIQPVWTAYKRPKPQISKKQASGAEHLERYSTWMVAQQTHFWSPSLKVGPIPLAPRSWKRSFWVKWDNAFIHKTLLGNVCWNTLHIGFHWFYCIFCVRFKS